MVDFVLDDLRGPAGKGFDPSLELFVLPLNGDFFEPLAGAGASQ